MDDLITEKIDTKNINTVIFDFGTVLVKNVVRDRLKARYSLPEEALMTLAKIYFENMTTTESETADFQDALTIYTDLLPEKYKKYAKDVFTICATSKEVYDYTVPLLKYLKEQGYNVYYLSNWNKSSFELCEKKNIFSFRKFMDGGIVSYKVGYKKPDPSIYKLLLKKYNLDPKKCIFFDDKKENCDAAKKLGINSVQFSQDTVKDIFKFPLIGKYTKESTKEEQDLFRQFKEIVSKDFLLKEHIKPLGNPKHTEFKKMKKKAILLGTADSVNGSYKPLLNKLNSAKISFYDKNCEFHSCYLPGDVFIFVELPKLAKESKIKMIPREEYSLYNMIESAVSEFTEAAGDTHIMMENLYPKVSDVLSTPVGDRKFKQLVGAFMDRNSTKLHTAGPTYMIPFADRDKAEFFNLFKIDVKWLKGLIKQITDKLGSGSAFKLLSDNPIYWVFYCVIRYYDLKKDKKGLNTALAIYALSNYPSVFHMSFPYPPNPAVMQYTMDNLSEKFIMKRAGSLFGGLYQSINNSFQFLEPFMKDASDKEMIRFIQRIRNDQKSMFKNICDQYMYNHSKGNRVKLNLDSNDAVQVDVDAENNTTIVQTVADSVVTQIITDGLDLRRVTVCKDIAQIGLSDCRFYLSKIVSDKYTATIRGFIYSVLFLFLYNDKKTRQDINSSFFIKWSSELFRKTNSNDPNISNIKGTLDKWAEETGVHAKFKREASRVNYKKAIFWYFILSIQYYNK